MSTSPGLGSIDPAIPDKGPRAFSIAHIVQHRGNWDWLAISAIGFLLRLEGLWANSFHNDEALYASFARLIAVGRDPLLRLQPVDKPPLHFYVEALFYPLIGPYEWAARLPNFVASTLAVPLLAALVWRLTGSRPAAGLAALFLALSPLAIAFSATVFLDPLLTTLVLAAGLAIVAGRLGWGGLWMGLALSVKYEALLFLPLLVGIVASRKINWARARRGATTFLAATLIWLLWALWRSEGSFDLWQNQMANFGGLRLARSWELAPRLREWLTLASYGLPWPLAASVVAAPWAVTRSSPRRQARILIIVSLILVAFGLYWLLAIPVWDRYLLPFLPWWLVLVAWAWARILRQSGWKGWRRMVVLTLMVAVLVPQSLQATSGQLPVGGQHQADAGAADVARYLEAEPYGTVLYDHWYSWQWRYHLVDKKVYVSWFSDSESLLQDLHVFASSGQRRYLALPSTSASLPVQRALAAEGYDLHKVAYPTIRGTIALYEIR